MVKVTKKAENARNHSQCDSLLLTDYCGAHTFPYTEIHNPPRYWNMRPQHQKSAKIKFSTVTNAVRRGRSDWTDREWLRERSGEQATHGVCRRSTKTPRN